MSVGFKTWLHWALESDLRLSWGLNLVICCEVHRLVPRTLQALDTWQRGYYDFNWAEGVHEGGCSCLKRTMDHLK